MPRAGRYASRTETVRSSVFERFLPHIRAASTPPAKLHIGDSDRPPAAALPLDEDFRRAHPHWFQYPNTKGVRALREEIARYHGEHHGLETTPDQILVTCGGTQALSVITQAVVEPGDEVLVPTPGWPFFRGMVALAGGRVVELPTYTSREALDDLEAHLERAVTPRTVALYVNSPNNPSGVVLDADARGIFARVARRHDLWLISDEAYDGMAFDGRSTPPMATTPGAPEATLGTFTFSKIHRFAGLRLGWLRGPADAIDVFDRVLVHQVYSAAAVSQAMMIDALRSRARWAPAVLADLQGRRDRFLAALGLDVPVPAGTYFCFFDASPWLGSGRNHEELVHELIDAGVTVALGGDFGSHYPSWIRACFAADTADRTEEAARRLRHVLEG